MVYFVIIFILIGFLIASTWLTREEKLDEAYQRGFDTGYTMGYHKGQRDATPSLIEEVHFYDDDYIDALGMEAAYWNGIEIKGE